jgi:hypothetical protein
MPRARLAVALLLLCAGAAVVLLASVAGAASEKRFHYTHRVTIQGLVVNHWTVDDPDYCGMVGDGTMTVRYRFANPPKVRPEIDPYYGAEGSNGKGGWLLATPVGGGHSDLSFQRAVGTITLVDNTTQRPPRPDNTCEPTEKQDCGSVALGHALASVKGYDRTSIYTDLAGVEFQRRGGNGRSPRCGTGQATIFSDRYYTGGNRKGELLIKMPSARVLAQRRVVRVVGTTHKRTSDPDCIPGGCTNDVTRTVIVTFTRL